MTGLVKPIIWIITKIIYQFIQNSINFQFFCSYIYKNNNEKSFFVEIFVVSSSQKSGIKRLRRKFVKKIHQKGEIYMKIKAGSWRMLSDQDKIFILKAISDRSKIKRNNTLQ